MKPAKELQGGAATISEIVQRLRNVPQARLRIIRDVVGALAEPSTHKSDRVKLQRRDKSSLLKTPFCGMWEGRLDLDNGQSYATKLRRSLEHRGDRT